MKKIKGSPLADREIIDLPIYSNTIDKHLFACYADIYDEDFTSLNTQFRPKNTRLVGRIVNYNSEGAVLNNGKCSYFVDHKNLIFIKASDYRDRDEKQLINGSVVLIDQKSIKVLRAGKGVKGKDYPTETNHAYSIGILTNVKERKFIGNESYTYIEKWLLFTNEIDEYIYSGLKDNLMNLGVILKENKHLYKPEPPERYAPTSWKLVDNIHNAGLTFDTAINCKSIKFVL